MLKNSHCERAGVKMRVSGDARMRMATQAAN